LTEGVQKYGSKPGKILIYTVDEIAGLLSKADKRLVPYLAIGALAGLRQAEIMRLDWSEVGEDFIEVTAEKAKTRVRRLVPVKPNLEAWIKDARKKSGPVCSFGNVVNQLMKLSKAAKVTWKKNALRHSYISYRVAECSDVARVAEESGNSAAIIRSNYLERVKPAQAAEWFAIKPQKRKAKKS
jgi:integrase